MLEPSRVHQFRPWWLLAALLLAPSVAGCGAQGVKPAGSFQSATTTPITVTSSASPPAAASASTTTRTGCDLPVAISASDHWSGGFLTYPSGAFRSDPGAEMTRDPANLNLFKTTATPVLRGEGNSLTYDRAFKRWLPVGRWQASLDGRHYAYAEPVIPPNAVGPVVFGTRIHVVDVASGSDRIVLGDDHGPLHIADYEDANVYLNPECVEGCGADAQKLWLLDPQRAALRTISDLQGTWIINRPVAWTVIASNGKQGYPFDNADRLMRIDLTNGAATAWWTDPGQPLDLLGTDANGEPMLQAATDTQVQLWLVGGQNHAELLATLQQTLSSPNRFGLLVADSTGVWLSANQGLYHYRPGTDLAQVSGQALIPAGTCR